MVCCSALYFSLTHAKDLVHILTVYLVVLCVLSGVSIIATLLHFILYPNNIVFFNFAIIGVAFATQHWLKGTYMYRCRRKVTFYVHVKSFISSL